MFSTQALQVRRLRRPHRIGDGVVDVADVGGFIAAREPTRQIPAPDERRQHRRGDIAPLGRAVAGMNHAVRSWRCRPAWPPAAARAASHHPSSPPGSSLAGPGPSRAGQRLGHRHLPQLGGAGSRAGRPVESHRGVIGQRLLARRSHARPPRWAAHRPPRSPADPQSQVSRSAPWPNAPNASARRCSSVRGSACTHRARHRIQALFQRVGVVANSRPSTRASPVPSSGSATSTWRPRAPNSLRRTAPGS